jgi:hypothetical protein
MAKSVDTPETDLPVEDEEIATHQEAIPVPFLAGTRKIAGRWISPATNLITKEAQNEVGKK